jgi:ABC-type multidrug transport system ATPase subunit
LHSIFIALLPTHSGAGKSTTINMLTGLTLPTSGTASLHGRDLRTELASVRSQLGYCPQHDVLFPTLSGTLCIRDARR